MPLVPKYTLMISDNTFSFNYIIYYFYDEFYSEFNTLYQK